MLENNNLVFSLYQENVLLCEKIMLGDLFGQPIDVRPILPKNIGKLQKVLSKTNYTTKINVGNGITYDNINYVDSFIFSFPEEHQNDVCDAVIYDPEPVTKEVGEWKMSGVECKIDLHINNKLIVERFFYVKGFNPSSRYSIELIDVVNEFCEDIEKLIKWIDINYMWEEFEKKIKQEEYEKSLIK